MEFYKKHKNTFDFLTFVVVIISLSVTIIFRTCDNSASKPAFEFSYAYKYLEVIHQDLLFDFQKHLEVDNAFKNIYNDNQNNIPFFIYNPFFITITITDKSTVHSTIKKIEIDNIIIENVDCRINSKKLPIFIADEDYINLKESTIVNFVEAKARTINLLVSIPLIFYDSDFAKINAKSGLLENEINLKNKNFCNENLVLKYRNNNILINKDFYEDIVLNSKFSFDLIFYDQNNEMHRLKNILLNGKENLEKVKLVGKSIVGH